MASKPKSIKNQGGRPEIVYDAFTAGKLHCALAYGMSQAEIQSYVGRDIDTLKKVYPDLFQNVKADRKAAVRKALFYQATVLNIPASTIFWLKTQDDDFKEKKDPTDSFDRSEFLTSIAKAMKNEGL